MLNFRLIIHQSNYIFKLFIYRILVLIYVIMYRFFTGGFF